MDFKTRSVIDKLKDQTSKKHQQLSNIDEILSRDIHKKKQASFNLELGPDPDHEAISYQRPPEQPETSSNMFYNYSSAKTLSKPKCETARSQSHFIQI